MLLDGSRFVRCSEVFAGNGSEGQRLAGMLDGLNAPARALVGTQCGGFALPCGLRSLSDDCTRADTRLRISA